MTKPRIGLFASVFEAGWDGPASTKRPHLYLNRSYVDAIVAAGGLPLVIPIVDQARIAEVEEMLDAVSGVLLTGGADLDPALYGQKIHPSCGPLALARGAYEIDMLAGIEARRLPVLGICLGFQTLNVYRGGTLFQDTSLRPDTANHRQETGEGTGTRTGGRGEPAHEIRIAPGSLLHALAGTEITSVNSHHHQVVDRLGKGLVATAWAPDGVIEAFEDQGHPFRIGVQWHPEEMIETHEPSRMLFQGLIAAAKTAWRAAGA